jgi:hypothetical protein
MKQMLLLAACLPAALASYGQSDSTQTQGNDTINIGSMVIIKKKDANGTTYQSKTESSRWYDGRSKPKRTSTSWLNLDLGFNNFVDKTDYSSAEAKDYARAIRPGEEQFTASDFNLRPGRAVNVNIWIFRGRYGITKNRNLVLTYGLMMELNNFMYDRSLRTSYAAGTRPFAFRDSIAFSRNKLAADYIAVPLMIGYDSRPGRGGFSVSAGVSVGYMYSSRNRQRSSERGNVRNRGNFDMEPWKLQYVAEIGFGPIKLYGSYSATSMFQRGLDHRPYAVGVRFGDW